MRISNTCLLGSLLLIAAGAHAQTLTTIYTFTGGADGGAPKGTLVLGKDGNFYGTTSGPGTVFKITPDGSLTTLYTLTGADGTGLFGTLALGNDGNFYGTTVNSSPGAGTIFRITPGGTFATIYRFDVTDGNGPWCGLVLGTDGNFYGTTTSGGTLGGGTLFKITPDGVLTNLHNFSITEGFAPQAALVQGADGDFYGSTTIGGARSAGILFKITPDGAFTTLHTFASTDGADPWGAMVAGTDGNFYGTTTLGGTFGQGTVFQMTPAGVFTTLYDFDGANGQGPIAGLTFGNDGNLYGVAQTGGASTLFGTLFEITLSAQFTNLHSFSGTDGSFPYSGLTLGGDGNFYGTTDGGGKDAEGTVFRFSPSSSTGGFSIAPNGVVNASSYATVVAPGSIAAVFGTFPISPPIFTNSFPIPDELSGVSLAFNGSLLAPLFYGGANQMNAQVPWELAGLSQTTVSATLHGVVSAPQTVAVATYAPGIFIVNSKTGQGAILDSNYQLVSPSNPVPAGSYIQVYCTGLGPVTNQPDTGSPALSKPLSTTTQSATAIIAGVAAPVVFSGLVPGAVGLYQVNAQVPAGVASGSAQPLIISIGGATSNTASVAIQ